MISRAVRAGLLPCVAPHRVNAAWRAGGQLLTTPNGSPFTGIICRPSGLGVLGSVWGTEEEETRWFTLMHHSFRVCLRNGEDWIYPGVPSTISSWSSMKNSLSGGRLGRFSVFSSCWIFVDTRLDTGTPTPGLGSGRVGWDRRTKTHSRTLSTELGICKSQLDYMCTWIYMFYTLLQWYLSVLVQRYPDIQWLIDQIKLLLLFKIINLLFKLYIHYYLKVWCH